MKPLTSVQQPIAVLLAAVSLCTCALVRAPTDNRNFELLILHNNDMHAMFEQSSRLQGICTADARDAGKCYGGFARVASVVQEARMAADSGIGPPVLFLNAGDTYTGTALFTIYKWKIAAEFINALQPDAISLGNHEFDNGVSGLTPFIESITSPVLCANIDLTKVPELASKENLKKSIVIDVNGNKIGIVGYLTPDTKVLSKPNDVEYIEEVKALRVEVRKLQSQGIKIIIALGHSGYSKDLDIGREVEGVDLVIGGHTNTFLWNGTAPDVEKVQGPYPTYVTQASGRRVPVVQAYALTKYLGKLVLTFDSDGEIISADGLPILLDNSIQQDNNVLKLLDRYRDGTMSTKIIGTTSVFLSAEECPEEECNLGNLITDAFVHRYALDYKSEKNHWSDTPIAILQAGSIRTSIIHETIPTNITKEDLLAVLPFEGNLTAVTMNGTILLQALEVSAGGYDLDLNGRFLQFSGLRVVYNMKKPKRSRVIKVQARCWSCPVPLFINVHENSIYKVIMPSYLSGGGDGYSMFIGLESEHLGYTELSSLEYYISHHSPVFAQVEGRITILNEDDMESSSDVAMTVISLPLLFSLFIIPMFLNTNLVGVTNNL